MSQENVEIVREAFDAFNHRDADRFASLAEADTEFRPLRAIVEGVSSTYRRPDGFRQFLRDSDDAWQEIQITELEFRDLGASVLALGRFKALSSGVELNLPGAWIAEFDNGRLVSVETFTDQTVALKAAALRE